MAMNTPSAGIFGHGAGLDVLQADMRDLGGIFLAADFVDGAVPDHIDLGMLEQAVLQDALGAEGCRGDGPASPWRRNW
jgi:hypothetical protein